MRRIGCLFLLNKKVQTEPLVPWNPEKAENGNSPTSLGRALLCTVLEPSVRDLASY